MKDKKQIYECDECGRKGKWEEEVELCSGCENIYCINGGCGWNREEDSLFICEACYPVDCKAKFIVENSQERIKLDPSEKYVFIGQDIDEAVEVLEKEGYVPKYRIDDKDRKIVKYGKDCGIYFLFDDNGKVNSIGIWDGLHRTDKNIGLFATREDVVSVYGDDFIVDEVSGYISYYHYEKKNLKFMITRVGQKRFVVTEIILC